MSSFTQVQLDRAVPGGLAWLLGSVMECRGRQELHEQRSPEVLEALRQMALIQSAESSNRIEGVTVDAPRLRPLVLGDARPRDRSEEEIVGYRRALAWIHGKNDRIEVTPETLRQLHRLAQGGSAGDAGQYKTRNNEIIELLPDGRRTVRFVPVTAEKTPAAVDQLCLAYRQVVDQTRQPPLLAMAGFVLDLLCIHPFRDGNGRVARLALLLLMYHQGFRAGRYISIERVVEQTKESYYDSLYRSSQGWHEAAHDPRPWWTYLLSTVRQVYREFEERVERQAPRRGAKTDAVQHAIDELGAEFTIAELERLCPAVSREQIRIVLRRGRNDGRLVCSSRGRGAIWKKVRAGQ
jgi:Fic family protein